MSSVIRCDDQENELNAAYQKAGITPEQMQAYQELEAKINISQQAELRMKKMSESMRSRVRNALTMLLAGILFDTITRDGSAVKARWLFSNPYSKWTLITAGALVILQDLIALGFDYKDLIAYAQIKIQADQEFEHIKQILLLGKKNSSPSVSSIQE
jgi:hypothetical protein